MIANNGLEDEALAQTAFVVFGLSLGQRNEWEECADKADWLNVADRAIALFDTRSDTDEINIPAREAADSLRQAFSSRQGELADFYAIPRSQQLAWEAVARHLFNCITAELDAISIPEAEKHWRPWLDRKLQGVS